MSHVSPFSATMIGCNKGDDIFAEQKKIFKEEAQAISHFLQGIHHSRKLSHQQVNYPETVTRLSKIQTEKLSYTRVPEQKSSFVDTKKNLKESLLLSEYTKKLNEDVKKESDINYRKRLYNKETGRKAILNQIINGTAPMDKQYLYPQKATHTQILAMTGGLKSKDPNKIPPLIKPKRKWLGEGKGWIELD